jgi:hypothetical protein
MRPLGLGIAIASFGNYLEIPYRSRGERERERVRREENPDEITLERTTERGNI